MFWLFLAAVTVASLTFVAIVVWAENRRKEREQYYRFEFRKRLVEAGKLDAEAVASLTRYEHELGMRQGRQRALVASFVLVGLGVGVCVGLQFLDNSVWKLGLIPASIGLSMLAYGLFFASKTDPAPPPFGWSSKANDRD